MQRGLFILRPHFLDSTEIRKETLKIWPSPADEYIKVHLSSDNLVYYNYILFNAAGQVFQKGTLCAYGDDSEQILDISDIPPGIYGIRVEIAGDDPDFGFELPVSRRWQEKRRNCLFLVL
jgi:hypothetical protein